MTINAVALDMDGTLLDQDSSVNSKLADILFRMQQRKIKIFVATGRTHTEVIDVIPADLHLDGIVSSNGAGCYAGDKKIVHHTLEQDIVKEVISAARKNGLYYEIHSTKGPRFALAADQTGMENEVNQTKPATLQENEYISRKMALAYKIHWVDHIVTENVVKIYFFSRDCEKMKDWKAQLSRMRNKMNFSISSSSSHNAEIAVNHVSKATGLRLLLDEYGLSPAELMAVGDSENDLPMFELAGYSVAMKNAMDFVRNQADEVTKYPYYEDGLYHFLLEKFFGIIKNRRN
ncbi:HAD family hydrolase [Thermoactinomyces mirandus]|uniref:HAD family phosphatase n=1 Tax=Thermoactinomyces mirandus TaxID=2756294 RepID=A0A7W1XSF5_9BACL|nr:HAD family hydrolase [Thermoactinomyces mirandus]MBA4602340.1 HAD family phosphatase [Thermoactinomyces mirandus]